MLTNVKLYYGNINARGIVPRAILYYKQQPFEDIRMSFKNDFPKIKYSGKFEFQQLPMLEINGKCYVQSFAIIQYLAKHFNLYGNNLEDEYQITSLMCSIDDMLIKFRPIMKGDDQNDQIEKAKEFMEIHAPFFLKIYENRFLNNNGKFMLGNEFSLADIVITTQLYNLFLNNSRREILENLLKENCPYLYDHIIHIENNELKDFFMRGYINEAKF